MTTLEDADGNLVVYCPTCGNWLKVELSMEDVNLSKKAKDLLEESSEIIGQLAD